MSDANETRLARAILAVAALKSLAAYIQPAEFPGLAKKVRSAIKSAEGAVRHAERMAKT